MIFHKNVTYGIKMVLFLAGLEKDVMHSAKEISKELHIPKEYSSKILQQLTKSGIIKSKRGIKGGFCLGKYPASIRLEDIIKELNESTKLELYFFDFNDCNLNLRRPLHKSIKNLRDQLYNIIHNYSVDDFRSVNRFKS